MRPLTGHLAGASFALSAIAAAAAYAQPAAPDDPGGEHHRIERQVTVRHGGQDQAERLRTLLQLKPSQEGALSAYLAAVRPNYDHQSIVEMSDRGDAKTTPQRLTEMEARVAEQAAQGHARIEAARKFYDQLEPSQKKVFDELPMLMIGPMGPTMPMGPMKMVVNLDGMSVMPPAPPAPPKAPPPPRS
jgi:LTXXQ motif family protein